MGWLGMFATYPQMVPDSLAASTVNRLYPEYCAGIPGYLKSKTEHFYCQVPSSW